MSDSPKIGSNPPPMIPTVTDNPTPEAAEAGQAAPIRDPGRVKTPTPRDSYGSETLAKLPDEGSEGSGVKLTSPDEIRASESTETSDVARRGGRVRRQDQLHAVNEIEFRRDNPEISRTPILEGASYARVQQGDSWSDLLARHFEPYTT